MAFVWLEQQPSNFNDQFEIVATQRVIVHPSIHSQPVTQYTRQVSS
jgi:hypothetical protein